MYSPTTRVLTVLEMLQARDRVTGAEIAERLEVHIRTVRRYIAMLEELGIPVAAERGRYGAYRLLPGFKLPPLMLTEEEALATTLGLLAARKLGLTATAAGVEGAMAKLERVLPVPLREKVRAVEETLVLDLQTGGGQRAKREPGAVTEVVVALSDAARRRQRVALRYRSLGGSESERLFDPYGLVRRRAYWYAVGYCHLRSDLRLFRLDRVQQVAMREEFFERPAGFDALDYVLRSLGSVPRRWPAEVLLQTTMAEARRWIAPEVAVLEVETDGLVLRCSTDDLPWLARLLASIGCPLTVRRPPELKAAIQDHAWRLLGMMQGSEADSVAYRVAR
jgi:predicted DNA-binding transcriptional regulator YafY